MASEGRGRRPASVPVRDGRLRRRPSGTPAPPSAPAPQASAPDPTPREIAVARRRSGITTRAIALGVVLLLLTISYASSLRVYFDQQRQLAEVDAEIARRTQHIDDLNAEIERWKDPNYVRAQARDRLGWVVPGETGYRVVGPDGKPVVPGAEVAAETGPAQRNAWWQKLEGSVRTADGPAPAKEAAPPVTPPSTSTKTVGPPEPSTTASKKR